MEITGTLVLQLAGSLVYWESTFSCLTMIFLYSLTQLNMLRFYLRRLKQEKAHPLPPLKTFPKSLYNSPSTTSTMSWNVCWSVLYDSRLSSGTSSNSGAGRFYRRVPGLKPTLGQSLPKKRESPLNFSTRTDRTGL